MPDDPSSDAAGADVSALLQALGAGPSDPAALLLSLLPASAAAEEGGMGLLLKLIGSAAPAGGAEAEDARDALREEIRAEQEDAVRELSETAERIYAELERHRRRTRRLGAALGACPVCLGDTLLCETCGGAGAPGWRLPRARAYREIVLPAVDRVEQFLREEAAAPTP